ncbi:MAG TPA: DUF459 domain-containing protein [Thermoleophilia bacterium]
MQNGNYTQYTSRPDRDRRRRKQRGRRRLLWLLVVVLVIAVIAIAVVVVFRGGSGDAGASGGSRAADAATSPSPKPTVPPPKVWVASKTDPVRVWVGGDSMGGELGWALEPVLKDTKVFKPVTFYKESTGICRYDFFDWGKQIDTVMQTAKPQAAVIMIGTNDTQSVNQDGKWIPYGDPEWKRIYEKRVGDIIDTMLKGGAKRVYWVGMPIMGESWRNSRMKLIDKIFQKQAEKRPGAEYIDIWGLFTKSDGSFDPSLRLADQVHFTGEGQALLADAVYKAIRADWLPPGSETPSESPAASPSASASSL